MNPGFDIVLYEASEHLGAFACSYCGQWHNVELARIQGSTLRGFCPVERTRVELQVIKRIPLDETPPEIKATAIVGRA